MATHRATGSLKSLTDNHEAREERMKIRFHRQRPAPADHLGMSRRMFLMTTTMAGVTTAAMLGSAGYVFAEALGDEQSATLMRMVQDIYPQPDARRPR